MTDPKEVYSSFQGVQGDKGVIHTVEDLAAAEVDENSLLSADAQRRLKWKIDMHLMPWFWLVYFVNYIDRAAVGGAVAHGFKADLGLVGNNYYNIGISLFFVAYGLFDVPSQLLLKHFRPKNWLPIIAFVYGAASFATAFLTNYKGFLVVRWFVGMAECGSAPGLIYLASLWYNKEQLTSRVSILMAGGPLATAVGPFIANGYVSCGHIVGMVEGWRNIFFGNGIITFGTSILFWFFIPEAPVNAKFLTEEERTFLMLRSKRLTVGQKSEEASHSYLVMRAFKSPIPYFNMIPSFLSQFFGAGITFFIAPIFVQEFHYSPNEANVHTGAIYFVATAWLVILGFLSEKTRNFSGWLIFTEIVALIGSVMFIYAKDPNVRYAGAFLAAAGSNAGIGPQQGWASANMAPYTTRATAIGLMVSIASAGGLIGAWIFLPSEASRGYPTATIIILTVCCTGIAALIGYTLYLIWENKQRANGRRDWRLEGKTQEEIDLLGNLHPDFRYSL